MRLAHILIIVWVLSHACPICGGVGGHMPGCPMGEPYRMSSKSDGVYGGSNTGYAVRHAAGSHK